MAEETEAAETMEAEHAVAEAEIKAASDIMNIDGVGQKTAEQLRQAGYDTIEKIASMSDEDILAVPGIGEKTAQKILLAARALLNKS
jgi:Holliday junction resolvasome RuvABC DNA-binding subunit